VPERIAVQVVLALPEQAQVVDLDVPYGSTVLNVVERSKLLEQGAAYRVSAHVFGIFGTRCAADTLVTEGDRIEIYRPLSGDPKVQRRRRATRQRTHDAASDSTPG